MYSAMCLSGLEMCRIIMTTWKGKSMVGIGLRIGYMYMGKNLRFFKPDKLKG